MVRDWQTRSSPQAWRHAWTSWTGLRLAIRSGASARVGPIEFVRTTALPTIAQTFVAVRFEKAGAQRILCYCPHQAYYMLRSAIHVGPTELQRVATMRTIVQSFVGVLFRKAGAQHILGFRMPEACYVLRPSGRVGRNGKLRIIPLVSCTQNRVAVCLKKA